MRVPDIRYLQVAQRSVEDRRADYLQAQEQALSGLRVNRPSDDPVAAARAGLMYSEQARLEGYGEAADHAAMFLQAQDDVLGDVSTVLSRGTEVAVQALNGTLSAEERTALSYVADGLREELAILSNRSVAGRYIFGGYADDAPPFDAAGNYVGSTDAAEVFVGPGVKVPMGVTGDEVFTAGGRTGVFDALSNLQTALQTNDRAGMQDALDRLQLAGNVVRDRWSLVGAYSESVDAASALREQRQYRVEDELTAQVHADTFDVFGKLGQARSALEAAVEIASKLPPPGLLLG